VGNMKNCRMTRKKRFAFLESGHDGRDEDPMNKHIDDCPECRRTTEGVRRILDGADAVREDLQEVMASIDWDALPRRIADSAFAGTKRAPEPSPARSFWLTWVQPRFRPVYAGLLMGIIVGAVGMLVLFKPQALRQPTGERYFASPDLIDRAELQLAKRETLDYLDKSQYLILDFVQAGPGQARLLQKDQASLRLQDMLAKKRYLNQQLDGTQMAKAREICNQIEALLLELSQISDELTVQEEARIKDFIEQRQILLKIKLLRKELQESEV